ncbi:Uncharacterised protein [Clostridioides difficile]|nr:hypothetical protein [Clostridioides difficile]MDV9599107.1 hypothetical protein [Clostridioides difficile]MDV9621926.1 hypothetical protein [Clostridioides difficile]VHX61884.1 Uncharacterised protein [Clostridioides difficile]
MYIFISIIIRIMLLIISNIKKRKKSETVNNINIVINITTNK